MAPEIKYIPDSHVIHTYTRYTFFLNNTPEQK